MLLAIDPGKNTAAVVLDERGQIIHKDLLRCEDDEQSFWDFYCEFDRLVRGYNINRAVIEKFAMFGFKGSVTQHFFMGRVVQSIVLVLRDRGIVYGYVPSRDVRQWLCGNFKAKPSEIKRALEDMGYTERMNEHVRDALALGVFYQQNYFA